MDNVTHSLAGLLLAESAVRLRARLTGVESSPRFRTVAATWSMIAANLPDADLFYTGVGGDRLRYLLHHRGYTHTVLIALLGATALWGVLLVAWRLRARGAPDRTETAWLFGLLVVSTLSHLVLDWTNSYGVHPFWPIDDRWRYGDSVFIVEPWLWVVSAPALIVASQRRLARVLLSLVLIIGLALAWRVEVVGPAAATGLTLGAALFLVLAHVHQPGTRVATAVAGWVAVTLVMAGGSARSRDAAIAAVHAADPGAELLDVVVSPAPANPLCASVTTVERIAATYRVMTARVSAAPSIVAPSSCGTRAGRGAAFHPATRRSTAAVQWDGEWSAPSGELAALAHESCTALAALRFIRAPIWQAINDSTVMVGDARFGDGSGNAFTDVAVPRHLKQCPPNVPPWIPPRAELLSR